MALETFSIGFSLETANRERQFAVTRLQFHVDSTSNFNQVFVVWWHHVVFRQVGVLHFNRLKNIKNSLIEFKHLTSTSQAGVGTYLLPLNVRLYKFFAKNHFPLEALAAFQDCGHVIFSGLPLTMKNLMVKSLSLTK